MVKGTYCLLIENNKTRKIKIGKKGFINFEKGYYCYIGSAMNNLDKRIERHKSSNKKMHWHIDYLLKKMDILDVKKHETETKKECFVSRIFDFIADSRIKDFGCSDCNCKSHLYYFKKNPKIRVNKIFKNI